MYTIFLNFLPLYRKLKDELIKIKSPAAYFGPDSEVSIVRLLTVLIRFALHELSYFSQRTLAE